jgi:SAM-dependent methyltransferase
MINSLLESPIMYEISQWLWYRPGKQNEYVTTYARPRRGERVLDIGCGVGTVCKYFPDVVYHGFDSNDAYVRHATRKYGSRGEFTRGIVGRDIPIEPQSYDLVMANGILHHLDDREALDLLRLAHATLKPQGRFVSRDGCFEHNQSSVVRMLLEKDRGRYVRTQAGYQELIGRVFSKSDSTIRRDMMRVPYSLIIFQCVK